jgi:ATP-dependent protease ClpP protease subunit
MKTSNNALGMLLKDRSDSNYINTLKFERSHHDIFLDDDIEEPSNYRELISLLFNASDDDSFNIFINSGGGHLTTALAIIEGLKNTQATVHAVLVGECHSAASLITMYCHEVVVLDSAHMMIHTASYGTAGNTGNVKAYTDFTTKQVESLLHSSYEGFLSKDEIIKIKLGVELWFSAEDIRSRMENRCKILNARAKKEAKQAMATLKPKTAKKAEKTEVEPG